MPALTNKIQYYFCSTCRQLGYMEYQSGTGAYDVLLKIDKCLSCGTGAHQLRIIKDNCMPVLAQEVIIT